MWVTAAQLQQVLQGGDDNEAVSAAHQCVDSYTAVLQTVLTVLLQCCPHSATGSATDSPHSVAAAPTDRIPEDNLRVPLAQPVAGISHGTHTALTLAFLQYRCCI